MGIFKGMAVHNGDPMTDTDYDAGMKLLEDTLLDM